MPANVPRQMSSAARMVGLLALCVVGKRVDYDKHVQFDREQKNDVLEKHAQLVPGVGRAYLPGDVLADRYHLEAKIWGREAPPARQNASSLAQKGEALPLPNDLSTDYEVGKDGFLGAGTFGETWKAKDSKTGVAVAIKVFVKGGRHLTWKRAATSKEDTMALEDASFECQVALDMQREKAKDMVGASRIMRCIKDNVKDVPRGSDQVLFIVLEFAGDNDLEQWSISQLDRDTLTAPKAKSVFKQIMEGLNYMTDKDHEIQYVHHDLKSGNIAVQEQGGSVLVKLIDFGSVTAVEPPGHGGIVATEVYAPVELWSTRGRYLAPWSSFDVFSAVTTFIEILSGGVWSEILVNACTLKTRCYPSIPHLLKAKDAAIFEEVAEVTGASGASGVMGGNAIKELKRLIKVQFLAVRMTGSISGGKFLNAFKLQNSKSMEELDAALADEAPERKKLFDEIFNFEDKDNVNFWMLVVQSLGSFPEMRADPSQFMKHQFLDVQTPLDTTFSAGAEATPVVWRLSDSRNAVFDARSGLYPITPNVGTLEAAANWQQCAKLAEDTGMYIFTYFSPSYAMSWSGPKPLHVSEAEAGARGKCAMWSYSDAKGHDRVLESEWAKRGQSQVDKDGVMSGVKEKMYKEHALEYWRRGKANRRASNEANNYVTYEDMVEEDEWRTSDLDVD